MLSKKNQAGAAVVDIPACTTRWNIPPKPLTCASIPYGLELPVSVMNQTIYATIPRSLTLAKDPIMKSKMAHAENAAYAAFIGKCNPPGAPKFPVPDSMVESKMKKMYEHRHQWKVDPAEYTGH